MGLMSKVLGNEKISAGEKVSLPGGVAEPAAADPSSNAAAPHAKPYTDPVVKDSAAAAHDELGILPCPACHSPGFWLSVYGGGLRCLTCEPPPGRSLVRRRLFLAAEPVDPHNPGGPWRRVLEPWEWHFGEGLQSTTLVLDETEEDPVSLDGGRLSRPVSRITWQWGRGRGGACETKVEKI